MVQTPAVRPLKNTTFCLVSALGSNFSPQNTQCIPAVKIFAHLELRQNLAFFKGLSVSYERPTTNAAAFAFSQCQKKYALAAKGRLQTRSGRITSYSRQWQVENLKSSCGQRGTFYSPPVNEKVNN